MTELSVVIPVYRAEKIVPLLVKRLTDAITTVARDYEIILVEDAGPDDSWSAIVAQSKFDPRVKGLRLSRNFGQHYAIAAGLVQAKGNWVVVMDCDLQDRPEEIPALYQKAQEGFDVVVARRKERQDTWHKVAFSKIFYAALSWLTGVPQNAEVANFGIYHKRVIAEINSFRENFRYFPVMVRWLGFRRTEIDVRHASRESGESSYNFCKLLALAVEIIVAFSDKPLRVTILAGAAISFASLVVGAIIFFRALHGDYVIQGWSSLMVSIWFLGGILMLVQGMIGLYLGRTYRETKRRPPFVIAERTNERD